MAQRSGGNNAPRPDRLPLRKPSGRSHARQIIAHHLILHGYGHWLPNDPRGSGSTETHTPELDELGPVHHGRKRMQPPRDELRAFYREATPRLKYQPIWFDDAKRQAVGDAFGQVVRSQRYTVWACAVLRNHAHLLVRRHRDDGRTIWTNLAEQSMEALRHFDDVDAAHPAWSDRPYVVYAYTPDDVRRLIRYIADNPMKEGLSAQSWDFVQSYDGWPHPKR
ncbi:MAG: hypothetical protein GC159_23765 [Phycisphaera sp.]|nr:hypothetical protein [Phycisphaera sp.]